MTAQDAAKRTAPLATERGDANAAPIGAMPRPRLDAIDKLTAAERESVKRQGRDPGDFEVAVYVVKTSRGEQRTRVVQRKGIGALVERQERARRSRAQRLATSRQPKSTAPAAERGSPRPQRESKARRESRPASERRRATERGDPSSSDDDPPRLAPWARAALARLTGRVEDPFARACLARLHARGRA